MLKTLLERVPTGSDDLDKLNINEFVQDVRKNPEEWQHERPSFW